ncbi:hypothetical protein K488DRAFT_74682 [Vararia minispora EC-137]|uniref:Uncharacterized protein n=1 Tax=Vararia minispora EC-137 TaxID=1314806 RepID=A0ACB8Q644_9AGAM|nr:hypothetical protein K488DRAFT_74682 [Vararia minispora EC-137]
MREEGRQGRESCWGAVEGRSETAEAPGTAGTNARVLLAPGTAKVTRTSAEMAGNDPEANPYVSAEYQIEVDGRYWGDEDPTVLTYQPVALSTSAPDPNQTSGPTGGVEKRGKREPSFLYNGDRRRDAPRPLSARLRDTRVRQAPCSDSGEALRVRTWVGVAHPSGNGERIQAYETGSCQRKTYSNHMQVIDTLPLAVLRRVCSDAAYGPVLLVRDGSTPMEGQWLGIKGTENGGNKGVRL